MRQPPRQRRVFEAVVLVVLGTLLISSWFAMAGATAFAQMMSP